MAKNVTIIGAGAVGIASALSLLELGHKVKVLDPNPPASGASHGNAGVISPWSCVPQSMPGIWRSVPKWLLSTDGPLAVRWSYLPKFLPWALRFISSGREKNMASVADAMSVLNRPNVELYRYLLKGTGQEKLIVDSFYVHVYRKASSLNLNDLAWRLRKERGAPVRLVQGQELFEIEPALSREYEAAVIIKDQARALDPGAVGQALADKAQSMGANFERNAVKAIVANENGGWILRTSEGEQNAEIVLLAAGAWSARLLKPLGIKIPLEAERGYHLVFRNPGIEINNSIMDTELKFVTSSMQDGVRCAGTAEFAGLDAPPNYSRAQMFRKLAKGLFPDINTADTDQWMGTRPSLPDSLPCIGAVPGHANLYVAFGHSHYGFGMAPATGRIVANVINGAEPNVDMKPYAIDRFG